MKKYSNIFHILGVLLTLFIIVGIPIIIYKDNIFSSDTVEAGGSVPLAEVPSGEYVILMNTSKHKDTIDDWDAFFHNDEDNIVVIFEDIICEIASSDSEAIKLGERYQSYLPVNQMTIKYENATLLVSKVEKGYLDVAIFSKEMADYLSLKDDIDGVTIFKI